MRKMPQATEPGLVCGFTIFVFGIGLMVCVAFVMTTVAATILVVGGWIFGAGY